MTDLNNKQIMARNLAYYIERSKKTQKEIAEIIDIPPSTFNAWMKAKKYPRIDKIELLADYFGILKSDLIEDKTEKHKAMKKDNDALSNVIVRMRTDETFKAAVLSLYEMDGERLKNLLGFLK